LDHKYFFNYLEHSFAGVLADEGVFFLSNVARKTSFGKKKKNITWFDKNHGKKVRHLKKNSENWLA
jgi:hypothetical protein